MCGTTWRKPRGVGRKKTPEKKHFVAIECYKNLHLHSKIFLSKRISWFLFQGRFWRIFEIGWNGMHIRAWICSKGILLQNQFSLFLCILKLEAQCTKLDRCKTLAQYRIMKWNPDVKENSIYLKRDKTFIHIGGRVSISWLQQSP